MSCFDGDGAEAFATTMGITLVDPEIFLHRRALAGAAESKGIARADSNQ